MALAPAFNFKKWIDENRHLLKPPVGNKMVWADRDFIVMVVGGPNARKDYHINEAEEFFYQLEGDMVLKVIDDGQPKDIPIREGDIYLLPPRIPHSPQRPANTVGLVIERRRQAHEKDGFAWFCSQCTRPLYHEYITLTNIEKDLPPVFERYFNNPKVTTCSKCGTYNGR